jgi:hypothetical protein
MKIMMVLPRHGESVAPFMTLFSFYDILCLVLALEFCLVVCLAWKLILRIEARHGRGMLVGMEHLDKNIPSIRHTTTGILCAQEFAW